MASPGPARRRQPRRSRAGSERTSLRPPSGTNRGVAAIYNRHEYRVEQRAALS